MDNYNCKPLSEYVENEIVIFRYGGHGRFEWWPGIVQEMHRGKKLLIEFVPHR